MVIWFIPYYVTRSQTFQEYLSDSHKTLLIQQLIPKIIWPNHALCLLWHQLPLLLSTPSQITSKLSLYRNCYSTSYKFCQRLEFCGSTRMVHTEEERNFARTIKPCFCLNWAICTNLSLPQGVVRFNLIFSREMKRRFKNGRVCLPVWKKRDILYTQNG